jgi:hypothetical protein
VVSFVIGDTTSMISPPMGTVLGQMIELQRRDKEYAQVPTKEVLQPELSYGWIFKDDFSSDNVCLDVHQLKTGFLRHPNVQAHVALVPGL